eukprot:g18812.t1
MGSFLAPSAQPGGVALPLEVLADEGLLGTLLGRSPELLQLYVANEAELLRAWQLAKPLLGAATTLCFNAQVTISQIPGLAKLPATPWPGGPGNTGLRCVAATDSAIRVHRRWSRPLSSRLDVGSGAGLHLRGSVPVADLEKLLPGELLRDQLPADGSTWLLTLEPLVDKFAFLRAFGDRRQLVLPLAAAESQFGPWAALRSQNYSDFRGRKGVTFQESGASSLLRYANGFMDHRWEGAEAQYRNFREYMVPTVPLHWVVETLLGRRQIDFLKIDAQGLDYSVFNSLGPYVGHVKRVQMELHEHASQNL